MAGSSAMYQLPAEAEVAKTKADHISILSNRIQCLGQLVAVVTHLWAFQLCPIELEDYCWTRPHFVVCQRDSVYRENNVDTHNTAARGAMLADQRVMLWGLSDSNHSKKKSAVL